MEDLLLPLAMIAVGLLLTLRQQGVSVPDQVSVIGYDDTRLADAMLDLAARHTELDVQRNEPYGPQDGVTHTLRRHAGPRGMLNVMLEIRNDLVATRDDCVAMADMLTGWIRDALERCDADEAAS